MPCTLKQVQPGAAGHHLRVGPSPKREKMKKSVRYQGRSVLAGNPKWPFSGRLVSRLSDGMSGCKAEFWAFGPTKPERFPNKSPALPGTKGLWDMQVNTLSVERLASKMKRNGLWHKGERR